MSSTALARIEPFYQVPEIREDSELRVAVDDRRVAACRVTAGVREAHLASVEAAEAVRPAVRSDDAASPWLQSLSTQRAAYARERSSHNRSALPDRL